MQIESFETLKPSYHTGLLPPGLDLAASQQAKLKRYRLLKYRFHTFFHPYVTALVKRLVNGSIRGLLTADIAQPPLREEFFDDYHPDPLLVVNDERHRHPVKDVDFASSGAMAGYNWELFYHLPMMIGIHLSRNQRYAEAKRWLEYVFQPGDDSDDPAPARFWRVRPFREGEATRIEQVLTNLATREDEKLWEDTVASIGRWKDTPFSPHAVARYRPTAYMYKAVMAYLDNLIEWGDTLFRQDTGESVNEALQLYVLAANLLGPRPQEVPRRGTTPPQTYASLRQDLDEFGNAMAEVEVELPFDLSAEVPMVEDGAPVAALTSVASSLYFCVPPNDKLLGYWDTVADRLFKIRNSLDIHGVFRQLPLFDPPIDPALLAKAAAAGLDIGSVVAGLGQPLPLVRFRVLVTKAIELCHDVRILGDHLLSAIEKQDAEQLAVLRARHERVMLELGEVVRYGQWQEAGKEREALEKSFDGAVARYRYYEQLLNRPASEIDVPPLDDLDVASLERLRFKAAEPDLPHRPTDVPLAEELTEETGFPMSPHEVAELTMLGEASWKEDEASFYRFLGSVLSIIPSFEIAFKPFGAGGGMSFGGSNLGSAMTAVAEVANADANFFGFLATVNNRLAGYERRAQEWAYQSNVVASEITRIYRQWRAAQIREALAEREWRNHQQEIRHAEEIEDYLTNPKTGQTTNVELYSWLRREVRGLYGKYFELAYDVAKKAERALQHELGDPHQSFLQFGYRSGKEGLLAGEKLYLDVQRMELAYHELNRREYELTSHVSLRQLDPVALLRLRATGACEFELPEEYFDLECPGHYFRRLRTVAVSVPCVVGPYAGVHATATLQRSSVRISPALKDGEYPRDGDDTGRFNDHAGGVTSVVTSSANQDSGLFEVNLHDERYLPFEGAGAIGRWRLELPATLPRFDHDSISDVVLHLRYTAREGGNPLRDAAAAHLTARAEAAAAAGSVRLLSVRHELPTEWARFTAAELSAAEPEAPLTITLRPEHYPFWAAKVGPVALHRVELFAEPGPGTNPTVTVATAPAGEPERTEHPLATDTSLGGLRVGELGGELPPAVGELTWHLDDNSIGDLWLALTWGSQP